MRSQPMTTRTHKIEWMGGNQSELFRLAIATMFAKHGASWLSDEQVDEIVSRQVADDRRIQRDNRESRAAYAQAEADKPDPDWLRDAAQDRQMSRDRGGEEWAE